MPRQMETLEDKIKKCRHEPLRVYYWREVKQFYGTCKICHNDYLITQGEYMYYKNKGLVKK